eukprot:scaffold5707_cov112-Cylindrotheca_fusiformis.AAC.13
MRFLNRKQRSRNDAMVSKDSQAKQAMGVRSIRNVKSPLPRVPEDSKAMANSSEREAEIESLRRRIQRNVTVSAGRQDMDFSGIAPLNSLADDDSDVLPTTDRYAAIESRDEMPTTAKRLSKIKEFQTSSTKAKLKTAGSIDSDSVDSAPEEGGCGLVLDNIMMCFDSDADIEQTYTQESIDTASSESSSDSSSAGE